jgi:hypothetical protein
MQKEQEAELDRIKRESQALVDKATGEVAKL